MKKVVFFVFTSVGLAAQTQGVPTGVRVSPSPELPAIVNDRFKLEHPNVTTTWTRVGDSNFEASFMLDSTHRQAQELYTSTGELIRKRWRLDKGAYPQAIDQYYLNANPNNNYVVWREDKTGTDTLFLGIRGIDTAWFGKTGNNLNNKTNVRPTARLSEKDQALLLDISLANAQRISMLYHVSDSSKVLSKTVLGGYYSQIDQMARQFGASRNVPLPDPMMPVGRIREPVPKDFRRLDKRLMKVLWKVKRKGTDQELLNLANNIVRLERQH